MSEVESTEQKKPRGFWRQLSRELSDTRVAQSYGLSPKVRLIIGLLAILTLLLLIEYGRYGGSVGKQSFDQPERTRIPGAGIAPLASAPLRPPADSVLWARFKADCWVRLKAGDEMLIDRLFIAGERLNHRGRIPTELLLSDGGIVVWWHGQELPATAGDHHQGTVRYDFVALAAVSGLGS